MNLRNKNTLIATRQDEGTLEFAVIPDFLEQGAILGHLDGITTIVHLASPLASQVRIWLDSDEIKRNKPN